VSINHRPTDATGPLAPSPAAALAADGDGEAQAEAAEEEAAAEAEILVEKRIRVLMGMKRYFHAKRSEGLLSSHGLRILNEAVDLSLDRPVSPPKPEIPILTMDFQEF
jgi:hypothetical protein